MLSSREDSLVVYQQARLLGNLSPSVQFSHSVVSDSLRPHGLPHARLPSPSPTPGACSNSCPLSWWCHPTILSSVIPFSSCLQSCPASGSFLMSQFFESGGQSIGVSASASVLPVNIQAWFPLGLTGLTPGCPTDCQESPPTPQFKSINSLALNLLSRYQLFRFLCILRSVMIKNKQTNKIIVV